MCNLDRRCLGIEAGFRRAGAGAGPQWRYTSCRDAHDRDVLRVLAGEGVCGVDVSRAQHQQRTGRLESSPRVRMTVERQPGRAGHRDVVDEPFVTRR